MRWGQLCGTLSILCHCLWDWNENWTFPDLRPLLSFPNLLVYWVQHFHSIIFQDFKQLNWTSITKVMLSEAHLTLHSRMSVSRWVMTPSWLSGSWKIFFVWFFCVFLPPLLNILCFCEVQTISVLYCVHLCMKYSLSITDFLDEISSLSHSIVFLYLHWSLRKAFLSCYSLENSAFRWACLSFSPLPFTSLLFSANIKAPSDNHFAFLHFFFLGMVLVSASYTMSQPPAIVLQALSISYLIPWIFLSLPLYNHKRFDLGHTWMI